MTESPVRRILVPVDFSRTSGEALRFASSLARALGASLEVLYVIAPGHTIFERAATRRSGDDPDAVRGRLHDFVADLSSDGVRVTERVEQGEPHDRIVSVARDENFDLIVMGTHGRTGRPAALVGSVAESVVRTSARPVLTVRESAA